MADFYNIALDCVDKHAQSGRTALHFVRDGKIQLFTFRQIKAFTDRFAASLASQDIAKGERIVISLPNCPEFIIAFLGAIKAGVIPIPVSSLLTKSELDFIVKDSGATRVINDENMFGVGAAPSGRPQKGNHMGLPLHNYFKSVRVCLSAGEKLPEEIRVEFKEATGLEIYEGLGMTEHSVYLVQQYGQPIVPGSCGKPLPGSRITILREKDASHGSTSSPCPNLGHPELVEGWTEAKPGEIGVLASHQSCEGLMLGYHNRPDEEKRVFHHPWFLSDDLAYRDEEGNFFFVGRRDDVITAGGYHISPLEVESVLNQHPAIEESAVVGHGIEAGKTIICAFIVCRGGVPPPCTGRFRAPPAKEAIIAHAQKHLAKYKIPREIVFVESLPKTSNGKIKRRELLRL